MWFGFPLPVLTPPGNWSFCLRGPVGFLPLKSWIYFTDCVHSVDMKMILLRSRHRVFQWFKMTAATSRAHCMKQSCLVTETILTLLRRGDLVIPSNLSNCCLSQQANPWTQPDLSCCSTIILPTQLLSSSSVWGDVPDVLWQILGIWMI